MNRYRRGLKLFILGMGLGCLAVSEPCFAQTTLGAREIALGQATSALPNSAWSVFENPAMINDQHKTVSFFGIQYYGLSAIADVAAVVTYPTKIGVIGGGAHRYGFDKFNETRIRLTYKNSFQNFNYGAAINYSAVVISEGNGSYGAVGIDLGISALVIDGLWIGAKATNVNRANYGKYANGVEDLPRDLSIGFAYHLSGVALFTTDVVKDVDFPLSYRGGIEIKVVDNLKARAGVTTAPQTFSGGFGYQTDAWGVSIVVQKHQESVLGYSPGLDFNIAW